MWAARVGPRLITEKNHFVKTEKKPGDSAPGVIRIGRDTQMFAGWGPRIESVADVLRMRIR